MGFDGCIGDKTSKCQVLRCLGVGVSHFEGVSVFYLKVNGNGTGKGKRDETMEREVKAAKYQQSC